MKTNFNSECAIMLLLAAANLSAATRYVSLESTNPSPPYATWATAATNIQDSVDAAVAGDEIVVTNGTYASVAVDKPLVLRSVNGPQATLIDGGSAAGAGCVYLTNGASLFGFTLTNGSARYGGGVYCESTSAVLSNCVLTGNSAGGKSAYGGGAYGGTLNNCILTGNSVLSAYMPYGGGAAYATLNNCTVTGNRAWTWNPDEAAGIGGGAYACTLNNCTLTGNSAYDGGGAANSTLNNCSITGNSADGGGGYVACGGGAENCTLNNCTLTGNSATGPYGFGGGADSCTLNNCIVYFNSDPNGGNYDPSSTLNYCCTMPMPTNGVGNISANPQLASASHLSAESPCIGAGSATYARGTDLDGEAWANPPSIGCDEYHAGAVTGPLTVSLTTTLTNAVRGYPVGLTAFIEGRTDLSVWEYGDGFVHVNEPYTSHTWTAAGDYLVALWAFNESHPEGVSATVTIHVEEGLHYVSAISGSPVAPYISWATAATNIQDAVDVAAPGATIIVTNGIYAAGGRPTPSLGDGVTNRVAVDKPLTVRSVNGPGVTVIQGQMPGATNGYIRCVYLTNAAALVGFTLTNAVAPSGGGVCCESAGAVVSNCVLRGNSAYGYGQGGGAYGGNLNNCTLTGNSAWQGGGAYGGTLNNCTLTSNSAQYGGGAHGGTLNNCTVGGNSADVGGGAYTCTLNNCALSSNWATNSGGGAAWAALNNSTLTGNSANAGGGVYGGTLNNCTVGGNSADVGGGAYTCTLNNCIVYFNTATNGANYYQDQWSGLLNYCCTTPMPTNGVGNITNAPLFVDYANGNLRLQSNSPCINAGNNAYVTTTTDLDGNPRIVSGTVDIGAYEYQGAGSVISYAWLQQFGLPTDGSADFTDPDRDGLNNWQEWRCGTCPTNANSALRLLSPQRTGTTVTVSWQSVAGVSYFLERATNLSPSPLFTPLASGIPGQPGTTVFTDTNAAIVPRLFYRVGINL